MSVWRALARRHLELPAPRSAVVSSREWVALSDGTRLATFVARPREGARATLLVRSAGISSAPRRPLSLLALLLAEQGLAVAVQECRGLRASEGSFTPFANEAADGADAIRWLAAQPWFARPLQLAGAGYGGYAAWAALARSAVPIERLVVGYAARDPHAWLHAGGALRLEEALALALSLGAAEREGSGALDPARALRHRPVREADRVGLRRLDWLREWLDHPARDAFWEARVAPLPERPPRSLLLAGWDHPALAAQLADHAALVAATREGAGGALLTVGASRAQTRLGQAHLVSEALQSAVRFLLSDTEVRRAPVRIFDPGAARWRELPSWPPPRLAIRRLYLRGDGRAQGADGDGRLDTEPPGTLEPPDRFLYDPADATPSDGPGSRALRGDVLCYASEPLAAPLALVGCARVELHVASDAPATDFCARLGAVDAAGGEAPICEGIARVSAAGEEAGLTPRRVDVECGALCWQLGVGSSLRLEIASASHPRFDRAPNTREEPARAAADAGALARQTLFHDAAHASCLLIETSGDASS